MPARILVIEDNKANLELMTYLLKAFGHTTLVAWDGEEGLEAVHQEQPDLVICDIELPKVDGYEIARRLKSNTSLRHIPLIAVTAFAMVDDRDKVLAVGFDGYISKPIEPELFVRQVEAFLSSEYTSASCPSPVHADANYEPFRTEAKNITILMVDNTRANLQLMHGILEPHGYKVVSTVHVKEALASIRESPPDLIISDLHMPISGYDFLMNVKSDPQLSQIPFMFVSSTMLYEEDAGRAYDLGAMRFLARPIEPDVLLAEIEACLHMRK
ncbi:MAG: response regulator [Chloroflexi bacterium]|nr:response regulator [Chloroflexota bacterium]